MSKRWRIIIRFKNNSETHKPCELRCMTVETNPMTLVRASELGSSIAKEIGWHDCEMEVVEA